jgi:surface antigen
MATCASNLVCACNANWDCVGHRGACSTNRPLTVYWDGDLNGETITAALLENLRASVRAEVSAYNASDVWGDITLRAPTAITSGSVISAATYNDIETMIENLGGGNNGAVGTTTVIDDTAWEGLIARYNDVRDNCICNTDCACNINCSCNTDCICNYSDERLKEEIEYC